MSEPVRVYVDMVGDLFHAGHVELLRGARALGDQLVVGVLSDETATAYKRRPVTTLAERVAVIEACRYVDEVVPDAPDVLTDEFLAQHRIDLVVHGDDLSPDGAEQVYGPAVRSGRYRTVPRTSAISTTELLARVHDRVDRSRTQGGDMDHAGWDREAVTFDDEPDHGLGDARTRDAWRDLLLGVLPAAPARIADLGCGTGTLTRLLTDAGHRVDGLDFSPEMVRRARLKVPEAEFVVADAADPPLEQGAYDVVLSRHVLWALPDPVAGFAAWVDLLKPDGMVVLVEGSWMTGAGLTAAAAEEIVRSIRTQVTVRHLPESIYWGKDITDERYLLVSRE